MLVDLRPRIRKPKYGSVVIDRIHPLARGLDAYYALNEGAGNLVDLVNGAATTAAASPGGFRVSPYGLAVHPDPGYYQRIYKSYTSETFTIAARIVRDVGGSGYPLAFYGNNGGARFRLDNASTAFELNGVASLDAGGLGTNVLISLVGTFDGSNANLYVNGALAVGPIAWAPNLFGATTTWYIGSLQGASPWVGLVVTCAGSKRAWTASEALAWHLEPYAVLCPRPIPFIMKKGASAPPPVGGRQPIPAAMRRQELLGVRGWHG